MSLGRDRCCSLLLSESPKQRPATLRVGDRACVLGVSSSSSDGGRSCGATKPVPSRRVAEQVFQAVSSALVMHAKKLKAAHLHVWYLHSYQSCSRRFAAFHKSHRACGSPLLSVEIQLASHTVCRKRPLTGTCTGCGVVESGSQCTGHVFS